MNAQRMALILGEAHHTLRSDCWDQLLRLGRCFGTIVHLHSLRFRSTDTAASYNDGVEMFSLSLPMSQSASQTMSHL